MSVGREWLYNALSLQSRWCTLMCLLLCMMFCCACLPTARNQFFTLPLPFVVLQRMRELYSILDAQLKPVADQLKAIEGIKPPDFNTYAQWLTHQYTMQIQTAGVPASGQGNRGGMPSSMTRQHQPITIDSFHSNMPVLVDLGASTIGMPPASSSAAAAAAAFPGATAGGGLKVPAAVAPGAKVLPPWLQKSTPQVRPCSSRLTAVDTTAERQNASAVSTACVHC